MSYSVLTEEQELTQDIAREFARNEVSPAAKALDPTSEFPHAPKRGFGDSVRKSARATSAQA